VRREPNRGPACRGGNALLLRQPIGLGIWRRRQILVSEPIVVSIIDDYESARQLKALIRRERGSTRIIQPAIHNRSWDSRGVWIETLTVGGVAVQKAMQHGGLQRRWALIGEGRSKAEWRLTGALHDGGRSGRAERVSGQAHATSVDNACEGRSGVRVAHRKVVDDPVRDPL
jgi:hypothetical protein